MEPLLLSGLKLMHCRLCNLKQFLHAFLANLFFNCQTDIGNVELEIGN